MSRELGGGSQEAGGGSRESGVRSQESGLPSVALAKEGVGRQTPITIETIKLNPPRVYKFSMNYKVLPLTLGGL